MKTFEAQDGFIYSGDRISPDDRELSPDELDERERVAAKAAKWAEIVRGQAEAVAHALKAWPDEEQKGWAFKLPEAEAILTGREGPTPYLDAELAGAGGRWADKTELAQKIVDNNLAFRNLHGFINGQQTALYDALEALAGREGVTAEEISALPVEYSFPEGYDG